MPVSARIFHLVVLLILGASPVITRAQEVLTPPSLLFGHSDDTGFIDALPVRDSQLTHADFTEERPRHFVDFAFAGLREWYQQDWDGGSNILLVQGSQSSSGGGGGGAESGGLAAKSQNPVSDLVSVPLQSNWDYGIGREDRTRYVGNLQPVVPVKLNEDWNLISRVIVPFVNTPVGPDLREHGIGDIIGQFFFSPSKPSPFIWGIGPLVIFPSASEPFLGQQQWGAGVTGVALVSEGPIVAGALMYQAWTEGGQNAPFFLQPFFNYNLPEGWFLSASGEASANWELPQEARWTFPLGAGFGRVFPIFGQPVNLNVRFAPYVEKPPGGPDWQFRFNAIFLFPK